MRSQKAIQEYLRRRRQIAVLYFFGVFVVCLMLVFYIWQYMQVMEIQLAISKTQKENQSLHEKIEVKQAERASLGCLERIEEIATRKLGMGLPAKEQMWYVPLAGPAKSKN
ncbi:MAG: cell division protein FtsL [Candidatus Riflebacteria bacterium]|nr:cell division protein FtsL [Candidatus Riflebacteria bacterium]